MPSDSATSSPASSASSALARLRRRRADNEASSPASSRAGSTAGIMKMYSLDDTPGIKVDPIIVLVLSLIFIGSVLLLHIWARFMRG